MNSDPRGGGGPTAAVLKIGGRLATSARHAVRVPRAGGSADVAAPHPAGAQGPV